ncbi:hypothetical protein F5J12DRAFT_904105 [Pisolithus orientalis]|uniref:uncharacterized protein n=1 Tax=Pisolithus orientalis TaxID=936130 RepID=UPI002224AF4E|nr:uncharacterized protein F5J12DRAFT_904105 [Pisolithus orientalis]KAI6019678.1 hypothetical protein F5J12DRAFT_904105 [Pisolithus orientalis]
MSPRASSAAHRSTASAAAPYPRRASGQPKSTRQQFSACGACRMRRSVCLLKCPPSPTSCSNCKERNIKCVDEFAEVKAVKLLRRGRRLQQVEAVYGKVTDAPSPTQHASTPTSAPSNLQQSVIPQLKIEFLSSTFFRRFCAQRPVIEPTEFTTRYFEHLKGSTPLSIEGQMLAMLLVTWATSFGINEYGAEMEISDLTPTSPTSPKFTPDSDGELSDPKRVWALRTEAMTREILALVDTHGILRRPSWDGVRVMLLLLPLTKGIQSSMERRTTYEATLSQVYALCYLTSPSSVNSGSGPFGDALVRARIFWYAYTHESVTTGLRGGRLIFNEDDIHVFQNTLPPQYSASSSASSPSSAPGSSLPSPASSSPVTAEFPSFHDPRSHARMPFAFMLVKQFFSLALSVSGVCRAIHTHLTGPRALQCAEAGISVAHEAMMNIWDNLTHCWEDFEAFRRDAGSTVGGGLIRGEDVERIVSGWQVFIFECLNVIRDALKHRVDLQVSSSSNNDRAVAANLHAYAVRRCRMFIPRVIDILKRHLAVPSSGFFIHDAGLIRGGCFFAGLLLAQSDLDGDMDMDIKCDDGTRWDTDVEEGVDVCLRALGEIRWVCADSHRQEKSLRAHWEARLHRDDDRGQKSSRDLVGSQSSQSYSSSQDHSPYMLDKAPLSRPNQHDGFRSLSLVSAGGQVRPLLPPLSMSFPRVESGPDTALTDDGAGSWSAYTPPTTSGSATSTIATQRSTSPTSPPPSLTSTEDAGYSIPDMEQFSFTVDGAATGPNLIGPGLGSPHAWAYPHHQHLDPTMIYSGTDAVLGRIGEDGCPHFGSDCQAFYHQ